ncbi:MAG: M20/M25/M40 family metallo-hydrolase, partial [Clostridia bacterium]|nr:M20/M25/M40 family metallo-hydrolase [Clostridia bacterium]
MKKRVLGSEGQRKNVSPEIYNKYAKTLKKMVDCKTVFKRDGENNSEYQKFYSVIEDSFPNITKTAQKLVFGSGCFVYVIKGKNATKNIMLMSHHDVVEGDDKWETPPFCATEKDGALYGRGT